MEDELQKLRKIKKMPQNDDSSNPNMSNNSRIYEKLI